MYRLSCRIEIEGSRRWELTAVTSIRIYENIDYLTDTLEVELPGKVKWDNDEEVPNFRGSRINVYLGYDEKTEKAFSGIITSIKKNVTTRIYAESEIARYKGKTGKKKSYSGKTFAEILKAEGIEEEIESNIIDCPVNYTANATTLYGLLESLQRQGMKIKMLERENGTKYIKIVREIVSGLSLPTSLKRRYSMLRNVIEGTQERDNRNKRAIGGIIINIKKGGKKEVIKIGSSPEEYYRVVFWNRKADKKLFEEFDRIARTNSQKGGNYIPAKIKVFGAGLCRMLELCEVEWIGNHIDYSNSGKTKKGYYIATKIVTTYGKSGLRQEIELGINYRN